ncbi:hypothetical protein HF521_017331 [Silurus meridionalis]|uniref:Uncharacterized protein n=1 Tax=Silurus meridionalis TaxID=175797 RepID=A0A8T0BMM8_SILME|nr:hypothetical protein HF521_017331 [Silurus meridionalis]
MKFVVCLLVVTAMVGFNALCQEVTNSKESNKKLVARSGEAFKPAHNSRTIKQRGANCACPGKNRALKGCQCKMQNALSLEEKNLCMKKGILKSKQCKAAIQDMNMKDKGQTKVIITPF